MRNILNHFKNSQNPIPVNAAAFPRSHSFIQNWNYVISN